MSAAERKRRYRKRQRLKMAVVPVEAHVPSLRDVLVDEGLLMAWDDEDFEKLCEATSRYLARCLEDDANKRDAYPYGRKRP